MPGHSRKRLRGWLLALALVAVLALAWALAAPSRPAQEQQTGRTPDAVTPVTPVTPGRNGLDFTPFLQPQTADDVVVVIMEGLPVTWGEIRIPVALMRNFAPAFAEEELMGRTIIGQVDQLLVRAEVRRRGLMPSLGEAREFMSTEREWCLRPDSIGAECREALRAFGYDPQSDEYWEMALTDIYQYELGRLRLVGQLSPERGNFPIRQGKANEYGYTHDPLLEELRDNAAIEWRDQRLERLYEHALIGRPILRP